MKNINNKQEKHEMYDFPHSRIYYKSSKFKYVWQHEHPFKMSPIYSKIDVDGIL